MSLISGEGAALISLAQNAALLACGVVAIGQARRRVDAGWPGHWRTLAYGLAFGLLSVFSMLAPGLAGGGYQFDLRHAMVALATVFGNPPAGLIVALAEAVCRLGIGGTGTQVGLTNIAITWAVSSAFSLWLARRGRRPQYLELAWLSLGVGGLALVGGLSLPGVPIEFRLTWVAINAVSLFGMGAILLHLERSAQAVAAMNDSARLFSVLYNQTPMMLMATAGWGPVVAVSDQWLKVMGYSREEVIGRRPTDFLTADAARFITEELRPRVNRGETVADYEVALTRQDGSIAELRSVTVAYFDPFTKERQVLTASDDQTAEKRAERTLQQRNEELRQAHRLGRMGHWDVDWNIGRKQVSPELLELIGQSWDGSYGIDFVRKMLEPADLGRFAELWQRATTEGAPFDFEGRIRRPDGEIRWMHLEFAPHLDAAGKFCGSHGILQDITERKRTEQALAERERQLSAIMDSAPIAIFLKDRHGRYQMVNRALQQWLGLSAGALIGRVDAEILTPDLARMTQETDRKVREEGRMVRLEQKPYLPIPGIERVLITKFPIRDESGLIVGIGGFVVDVTDRYRAEAKLRRSEELLLESQRLGKLGYMITDARLNRVVWSDTVFDLRRVPRRPFFTFGEAMAFAHPDDRTRYLAARETAIREHRDFEIDTRVYRGDGSMAWEHSFGRPQYDADGSCTGVLLLLQDVTERKQAELALAEKERELSAIMDNAPMAIFTKDATGRYLRVNRRTAEWAGMSPAELVGKTDFDFVPADKARQITARDRTVFERGESLEYERANYLPQYGPEYFRLLKFPIGDGEGRVVSVATLMADVTERRRAELALQQKEQELSAIMDNAPMAIILKDRDGRFLRGNRRFEQWTGQRLGHARGKTDLELLGPEQGKIAVRGDREVVDAGKVVQFERPAIDNTAGFEHVSITKFPVRDASGTVIGIGVISADVTARRRAEQALRESEERFRALIEHSNDFVVVVDVDATVRFASPSISESFGRDNRELVGRPLLEFIHPQDQENITSALAAIAGEPGNRAAGQSRVNHLDGGWRVIAWSARNAADVPGVNGIIVNARDVTGAKNLEEQLLQSQKMEAVGQLASGIAHDFNNILGAVQGFAGFLLQDLPAGSPLHGYAARIDRASERAKELVQQILAFARRSNVERQPTDLGQAMSETLDLLRVSLPSSTTLSFPAGAGRLVVQANAAQMQQMLLNLALNANDALAGEPGTVSVSLDRVDPGSPDHALFDHSMTTADAAAIDAPESLTTGQLVPHWSYARLIVTDTGQGMPPEVLRRIFDPFFTTKERGRGTGLGLAVVHGIIASYDGACRVTSRPNGGTSFAIYLPLSPDNRRPAPADGAAGDLRGHERIMIVDDEADLTDVASIALDRLGYEVVAVNDPEVAFEAFAEDPDAWDLVVSDQMMPQCKGMTLFSRMKQLKPSLRFILCTGFSDSVSEELAGAAGIDAYLLKPMAAEQLAASIRRVLDRSGAVDVADNGRVSPSAPRPR